MDRVRVGGAAGSAPAIAATVVVTGLALMTMAALARAPVGSVFPRVLPSWAIVVGLGGLALLLGATWAAATLRSLVAVGLSLMAVGLIVPVLAGLSWLPPWARAAALAIGPLAVPGAAQAGLRWGGGDRGRALTWVYALALAAAVVHLLAYDPFADSGCDRTCLAASPLLAGMQSGRTVERVVAALTIAAAALGMIAAARIPWGGSGRWVGLGSTVALGFLGVDAVVGATGIPQGVVEGLRPIQAGIALEGLAAAVVGAGVLAAAVSALAARRAIRGLVRQLGDPLSTPRGGSVIRRVDFAVADGRARPGSVDWVDATGGPSPIPGAGTRPVVVEDARGPVLRLLVGGAEDAADVLAGLTPAAQLALRNAQLAAATNARLAEVRGSQRRIVAASDAERRRIERDLHDGAQQRLVAARFHLGHARNLLADPGGELAAADAAVARALERLRRIGHGIFPPAMVTEGLTAALEDLAADAGVGASVDAAGLEDVGLEPAMAGYAAAAIVIDHVRRHPPVTPTRIRATVVDGWLEVVASGDGTPLAEADIIDMIDRVGALGGEVRIGTAGEGVLLEVRVPCVS